MARRGTRRKRSSKSYEGYRRKRVGDLRHMLQCCRHGRLAGAHCEYLESVLCDELHLPSAAEIAAQVQLTNDQRERNKLWTIPPIDKTKAQLAKQRKDKDRRRKLMARRKANVLSRDAYRAAVASNKPWLKEGKTERTWYRHRAKAAAAAKMNNRNKPKENWHRSGTGNGFV